MSEKEQKQKVDEAVALLLEVAMELENPLLEGEIKVRGSEHRFKFKLERIDLDEKEMYQ